MNLQTFRAPTIKEALDSVKRRLGPDAVIVGTRTIERHGVMGLAGRTGVEITAMSPQDAAALPAREPGDRRAAPRRPAADGRIAAYLDQPGQAAATARSGQGPDGDIGSVVAEIHAIKEMVARVLEPDRRGVADRAEPGTDEPDLPQSLLDAYVRLIGEQVAREWADDLFGAVAAEMPAQAAADPTQVRAKLSRVLQEMLPTAPGILLNPEQTGRMVAFIGPTGAGKTTTVAKLAWQAKRRRNADVALVTTDVERPGSAERLRAYAAMLEVPFEAVHSDRSLRQVRQKYAKSHLIFLDTAGCGAMDSVRLERLKAQLSAARPEETYLVVSATTQPAAAREAIRCFRSFGADRVVVSKVDEAVGLGVLLALAQQLETRLTYLATGQNVPTDIQLASAQRVAQMILQDRPAATEAATC